MQWGWLKSKNSREVLMAVDPVCGVHVDERAAQPVEQYTADYNAETFYFCSEDCKRVFEESPVQYARKSA
jgi:YHS domain-containing protein